MCNKHIFDSHFRGSLDLLTPVYKYIPFCYFVEMLAKKELRMEKVKSWEDTYELFFYKEHFFRENGEGFSMEGHKEMVFGQSWTLLEESDAMWRLYSPDKNSVRIKSTVCKLWNVAHNEIANIEVQSPIRPYIGKVRYMTEEEISKWVSQEDVNEVGLTGSIVDSLFMKRDVFSYEEELRVIHFFDSKSTIWTKNHISYKLDPHKFIDEICLDPRTSPPKNEYLRATLMDLGVCPTKIVNSNLYHFEPQNVTLYRVPQKTFISLPTNR